MNWRRWNPWHALRHDIGRKFTALALALVLWGALENFVVDEKRVELDVRVVPTLEAADREAALGGAVFLVVPDDLIVIDTDPFVRLKVKGLADDVANLNVSAALVFNKQMLGEADESNVPTPLERATFKSRGPKPRLTDFRITPDVLHVTLARRETLEDVSLTGANVALTGEPRDGYVFENDGIRVVPNTVTITGPRGVLKTMAKDPTLPQLEPVDVGGKTGTVVQRVGLCRELIDQGVSLLPAPGTVTVTIPVEPEDMSVNLLSVKVHYDNEDALAASGRRVVSKTETLDLKLTGPRSELSSLKAEQLGRLFQLRFDWASVQANEVQGRPKVAVLRGGLSYDVHVLLLDSGDDPIIEYHLENLP